MFSFKTKVLAVSMFCLAASFTASAQLSMPVEHRVNSPQFNQDGTVTFRLYAPQASGGESDTVETENELILTRTIIATCRNK